MNLENLKQCHLWNKDRITKEDFNFEVIEKIKESSHFDRFVLRCKRCRQLYLYEFEETVELGGGDVIKTVYVPVDEKDLDNLKINNFVGLYSIKPRIQWTSDKIFWIR